MSTARFHERAVKSSNRIRNFT